LSLENQLSVKAWLSGVAVAAATVRDAVLGQPGAELTRSATSR
jgi:hypothetical protein